MSARMPSAHRTACARWSKTVPDPESYIRLLPREAAPLLDAQPQAVEGQHDRVLEQFVGNDLRRDMPVARTDLRAGPQVEGSPNDFELSWLVRSPIRRMGRQGND
jgi:hypothetical protein